MSKKGPLSLNACNQIDAQIVCSCCFRLHIQRGIRMMMIIFSKLMSPSRALLLISPIWPLSTHLITNFVTNKQCLKQILLFLINTNYKYAGSLNTYLDVSTMPNFPSNFSIESPKVCQNCYFLCAPLVTAQ